MASCHGGEMSDRRVSPQITELEGTVTLLSTPGRAWGVLSPVFLRSTGLPAQALTDLRHPPRADPDGGFDEALQTSVTAMMAWAGDPRVEEALAWQNPATLDTFRSLLKAGESAPRNARRRDREHRLARYLTRYAGKTETIGFFGPSATAQIDDAPGHLRIRPGQGDVIRCRRTYPEAWAVRDLGARLAAIDSVRAWLPVRRRAHLSRRRRTDEGSRGWTDIESAVLAACDGRRPAEEVCRVVAAVTGCPYPTARECLSGLVIRRALVVDANLPLGPESFDVLLERVGAIGEPSAAEQARVLVHQFAERLDDLARSAGDADRVRAAHDTLATTFEELAGSGASRRAGQMYAGRSIAYEECFRDVDVVLGQDFVNRVEQVVPAVVVMGRWLTHETACAYEAFIRERWGLGSWPLGPRWFELLASFHGAGPRPVDAVLATLAEKWQHVLGRATSDPDGGLRLNPDVFQSVVAETFVAPRPGWAGGVVHSPDLQICEHSPGGVASGDYTIVVSEVHFAQSTFGGPVFEWFLDDYPVTRSVSRLTGPGFVPMLPDTWPRNTGRTLVCALAPDDTPLTFVDVQGAPANAVPVADIELLVTESAVQARLPDGRTVGISDLLGVFLTVVSTDGWKSLSAGRRTPRLSVGDVTVVRETWRIPMPQSPLAATYDSEEAGFRAMRQWQAKLSMPDEVYLSLPGETKPLYLAFDAPAVVLSALAMARRATRRGHTDGDVVISEARPTPAEAWLPDADGDRYHGELRLVAVDTEHCAGPGRT